MEAILRSFLYTLPRRIQVCILLVFGPVEQCHKYSRRVCGRKEGTPVAKKERMGWVTSMKRWQKRYQGKLYTISPRQLGVQSATKAASREAANQWWETKKAEIDKAAAPAIPIAVMEDPKLKLSFAIPPEIDEIVCLPREAWTKEQRAQWEGWNRQVRGKAIPLIRGFQSLCEDEPTDRSVGSQVERFLARKLIKVDAGEIAPGRYESYRCEIEAFRDWIQAETLVQSITAAVLEDYLMHLHKQVARRVIAPKTAAGRLSTAKQFIRGLWEIDLIELPKNIDGRKMRIKIPPPDKKTIPLPDLKKILRGAGDRMRLYLLLMLNCGLTQTDIAQLRLDEVDWKTGRIKRKRSKTRDHERVPEVNYLLWPETLRLLRHYRSDHEALVLLNADNRPLRTERIVDGRNKVNDAIKNAYWRLQQQTKTKYPLKLFRKTAATLLASHEVYAKFVQHFLGHAPTTIADRHYVVPSQEQFDHAVRWLGQQISVEKASSASSRRKTTAV